MEGNADGDRDRVGIENSIVEDDRERGRFSIVRCPSQSSLDESSQRPAAGGESAAQGAHHAATLLGALAGLRRDHTLCDVRLQAQADGAAEPAPPAAAHRAVLAASSPYFHAMFTQFDERTRPTVTIQNVEPEALEAIVQYIYAPDSLHISEENVQAVLSAASLLQVCGVRDACCTFLRAALAPDNALGIRAFADLHACADLARAATDYIHAHFANVLETEEFLALEAEALAQLLDSDRIMVPNEEVVLDAVISWMQHDAEVPNEEVVLDAVISWMQHDAEVPNEEVVLDAVISWMQHDAEVPNEEVVLDAVISWMQHDAEARRSQLGALLEHVRLPLVAQETLVARAAAEPLSSAPVRVKDLLIEALSFHLLRPERRALLAAGCPRARARDAPHRAAWLLVAGGQAPKAIREVEALRLDGAWSWRRLAALPGRRCRAGLAVRGGRVFAVGGFNGTLRVRSVDVYDGARDAWAPGPPLAARRSTLGVAVLHDVIYAVGGFDGATGLSSGEALAPGAGAWRPIAPMAARRSSVGVCVLRGYLYAVGGYDGGARACLSSVERYCPAADAWEAVADMGARRSGCGVGVLGDRLYAVGGHDGPAVRRSVERYSDDGPRGEWTAAASMHSARRNAAVAAHRGQLYAVGGDDGAHNLATVEVLDGATETWTVVSATMSIGRSYAGVCVLERGRPEDDAPAPAPAPAAAAAPAPAAS